MTADPVLPARVAAAVAAVRAAGRLALAMRAESLERWEKAPGQLVTAADLAVERLLLETLRQDGEGWLSEEEADDGSRLTARHSWIVDPIDGTRAYAAGGAAFAVTAALVEAGRPQLALIYRPVPDRLLVAVRGAGVTLDGQALPRADTALAEAAGLVVGRWEERRRSFSAWLPDAVPVEVMSLACTLADAAQGRSAGYLSWRLTADWDLAAAALILAEAGLAVTDGDGRALRFDGASCWQAGVLAAAPARHAAVLSAGAAARAAHLARAAATVPA